MYAFIVSVFVYGATPMRNPPKALHASANTSAVLLYIIITNAALRTF